MAPAPRRGQIIGLPAETFGQLALSAGQRVSKRLQIHMGYTEFTRIYALGVVPAGAHVMLAQGARALCADFGSPAA
jgi:hypothetical protein